MEQIYDALSMNREILAAEYVGFLRWAVPVLSLLLLVAGGISLFVLPIDQYPSITPPTVQVSAIYPGANAETIVKITTSARSIIARCG